MRTLWKRQRSLYLITLKSTAINGAFELYMNIHL